MTSVTQEIQETMPDLFSDVVRDTSDLAFERKLWAGGLIHVAGVDEAGRGCLAGPVVAAAVILPQEVRIEGVTDSKLLREERRTDLALKIKETALAWSVASCSASEIDELNILWAAMEAMRRAIEGLTIAAEHVLIDGNTSIPNLGVSSEAIIKGDSRSHTIAAASILAKTHRDAIMKELHVEYPAYGWITNVGYPTNAHYVALRKHGVTDHHRRTFRLV